MNAIGVAIDSEARMIVMLEDREDVSPGDMVAEIGRDVAEAKAALRVSIIEVRLEKVTERLDKLPVPAGAFFAEGRRVGGGVIVKGIDEIAVNLGLVWIQGQAPTEMGDGFVDLARIFQDIAEVALQVG